jgi:sirohydrochlorin ferrochelatase
MPRLDQSLLKSLDSGDLPLGIVVIDHGSKRDESNILLHQVAALFAERSELAIVEPAHMELSQPDLATAFDRCVKRGARLVAILPYFLGPGRHWSEDIPRLAAAAAERHSGIRYFVSAPLGLHPLLADVMAERLATCLQHQMGGSSCEWCQKERARCQLR